MTLMRKGHSRYINKVGHRTALLKMNIYMFIIYKCLFLVLYYLNLNLQLGRNINSAPNAGFRFATFCHLKLEIYFSTQFISLPN